MVLKYSFAIGFGRRVWNEVRRRLAVLSGLHAASAARGSVSRWMLDRAIIGALRCGRGCIERVFWTHPTGERELPAAYIHIHPVYTLHSLSRPPASGRKAINSWWMAEKLNSSPMWLIKTMLNGSEGCENDLLCFPHSEIYTSEVSQIYKSIKPTTFFVDGFPLFLIWERVKANIQLS